MTNTLTLPANTDEMDMRYGNMIASCFGVVGAVRSTDPAKFAALSHELGGVDMAIKARDILNRFIDEQDR